MAEYSLREDFENPDVALYQERKSAGLFCLAKDRYTQVVNHMKANIRDIPLESLLKLTGEMDNIDVNSIPELTPETKAAVLAAKREIHRRAFKGFTVVPSRKFDSSKLGFLRKPAF